MADALRTGGQVLFAGLLVAAGIFAPAVVIPATATASPYLFQGLLATLGAVGLTEATKAVEERRRRQLSQPSALLRNHDLQLLVSHALERAMSAALDDPFLKGRAKEIKQLAKQVPGYFRAFREAPPESFADVALPGIVRDFAVGGPAVEPETWVEVVEDLAIRARCTAGIAGVKKELAAHLGTHFERFVMEVFKEDAAGKGPAGGKGWAALEMLFWGLLRADLQGLGGGLESLAAKADEAEKLALQHADAVRELDCKLDELIRWHGPGAVKGDPELTGLLRSMQQDLGRRLDEIADLIGHGLLTPYEFEIAYWRKRRQDPGAQQLWSDPDRAQLLTGALVGRDDEVEAFGAFLEGSSPWVWHRYGYPGNGKSRLMIAFAKTAVELGRRVYFVGSDVHDLGAALRRAGTDEPLVLLWDDYRGDQPEVLRVFLGLDDLPGPVIKRAITSWPTIDPLGEKSREAHYRKTPLGQVVPAQVLSDYTRKLLPRISKDDAAHIVRLAEGHPQTVLLAAELVLSGTAPANLPVNLLEDAYDRLIARAIATPGLGADDVRRALLALALAGWVDYARPSHRKAFERAGVSGSTLGALARVDLVAHEAQVYGFHLDGFRAHVVRRSLDFTCAELLSGDPALVASRAAPLLEEWVHAIWGVCVLATGAASKMYREPLQRALLRAIRSVNKGLSADRAAGFAHGIANATSVEPIDVRRTEMAEELGTLLSHCPTTEVAHGQALAFYNATVGGQDPGQCAESAREIGHLLERYPTKEIALFRSQALVNATTNEKDSGKCAEYAAEIGVLVERYQTDEIALAQAQTLYNAFVVEQGLEQKLRLIATIGELLVCYPTKHIAAVQARGYVNLTAYEPNGRRCVGLIKAIWKLLEGYPSEDIAARLAEALVNATALVGEPSKCVALADQIGEVLKRYTTNEIALAQAHAYRNGVSKTSDPQACLFLAERIAAIRRDHDTAAITLVEAFVLWEAARRREDSDWRLGLAGRIGALREQHDEKKIAMAEVMALELAMEVEADEARAAELRGRIEGLVERYGLGQSGDQADAD